jgi:hypothetical protein
MLYIFYCLIVRQYIVHKEITMGVNYIINLIN